ncbi:MAG: hypothetical protein HOH74_07545 [Gemmatimonadetes bacterium]|nr:hypothetical protein [Gemmatimonadota bacterium]
MTDEPVISRVHWSFWAVGAVTLIWNLMGVLNYLAQTSAEVVAAMPETHRAIIEGRPGWATSGFAIGVFGGTLGCVLLLLRKPAAFYLFVVSLLGVIVTMIHTVTIVSEVEYSSFETGMMTVMPIVGAVFLVWYSKKAESKGWIS